MLCRLYNAIWKVTYLRPIARAIRMRRVMIIALDMFFKKDKLQVIPLAINITYTIYSRYTSSLIISDN